MNTKTHQKLWIFGDSFANIRHAESSWQLLLKNKFVGNGMIVSGRGGRDIQTIIDIFLKSLHLINDGDFVIMILPTSARVRYPIAIPRLEIDYGLGTLIKGLKESLLDGFTSYHAHSSYHTNIKKELIYPLNIIDDKLIEDLDENDAGRELIYGERQIKHFVKKASKLSYNQMSTLINTSESVLKNYNQQFYSFSKGFKFKTLFLSWADDFDIFDESVIITKSKLEKELGHLHTDHEMFLETNGKKGKEWDFHWSERTDAKFSEYIIKNNPLYFN